MEAFEGSELFSMISTGPGVTETKTRALVDMDTMSLPTVFEMNMFGMLVALINRFFFFFLENLHSRKNK